MQKTVVSPCSILDLHIMPHEENWIFLVKAAIVFAARKISNDSLVTPTPIPTISEVSDIRSRENYNL